MTNADAITARLAAGHNGILTTALLQLDGGLTPSQVKSLQSRKIIVPLGRGVFRHAAVPLHRRAQLHAAVLVGGEGAFASHRSAAELHGLDDVPRFRPEILQTALDLPRFTWLKAHRTDSIEPEDTTVRHGIPTTSVARTIFDLGAVLPYDIVANAAEVAVINRQVDVPALLSVLERLGRRGRAGTATLRAFVRHAMPDERIESLLEHRLLELVRGAGLPAPHLQHLLMCGDGRAVRLDMAWPARRLAIEADGLRWHGTHARLQADLARSRSIAATGWTHYRFGWQDVHGRRQATLAELCRVREVTWPQRDKVA